MLCPLHSGPGRRLPRDGADDGLIQHRPRHGVLHHERLRAFGHGGDYATQRDGGHHRGRELFGEHSPVGGDPAGITVHLGAFAGHDFDRL